MRVFVTGATGFVGSHVVRELLSNGHKVLGLARSTGVVAALNNVGADAHLGSLEDVDCLRRGANDADAVVHLAYNPDFSKFRESSEVDRKAIEAMGAAIAGSAKPLIVPNGIAGLGTPGHIITENDDVPSNYRFPRVSEQTALGLASRGILATVIRLPQVHNTVKQGLVSRLVQVARAKGLSAYIGDGRNRWPAAHVSDVARLFRLVLETPEAGAKYHAVAEEGVELRVIAGVISRVLGVPEKSISAEEAQQHFGPLSMFVGEDMPASAHETKRKMAWNPQGPTLIADLERIDL
ncbi:MAG TPA: SDR family oxidoreductase [Acetobacteraceae bacterium]|nr:SDR family oxidoreductase [Acetobacteraceae bacterium]